MWTPYGVELTCVWWGGLDTHSNGTYTLTDACTHTHTHTHTHTIDTRRKFLQVSRASVKLGF